MTGAGDVTLAELARRLDAALVEFTRRLDAALVEAREGRAEIRELSARLDVTYVRRDVYEAERQADKIVHHNIDLEVKETGKRIEEIESRRSSDRRLVFSALVAPLIIAAVLLIVYGSTAVPTVHR